MKKLIVGLLLLCSLNVLEASSRQQIAIGYNPADFTMIFNGKPSSGEGLANMVNTILFNSNCSNDSSRSYHLVESENPRMMKVIMKEINLGYSRYVDPATRLTLHTMAATHLLKGSAIVEKGIVSINLRIEDRQDCLMAQAKLSGPEKSFYTLIEDAARSLSDQICNPDPNLSSCTETYYTVTTSQKTIVKAKPIEKYRGISTVLKSYVEDDDTYYIYVDTDKAKIVQYHVDEKSTRKIHKEKYVLNDKSCQYEIKKEDKLIKNTGGSDILKSEDAGWGFENDTKIAVLLPSSDKELSFTWGRLKENGRYSNRKKYKQKIPEITKSMMGKMNEMATLFRNESKNNKDMKIWKSLYDYPGTPQQVSCGGKVSMESLFIPPLDGLQDPEIEFKIDIRLSTQEEIAEMKSHL